MNRAVFVDIETSGLDPVKNQILEVAMVEVIGNTVLFNDALHFYIEHPEVCYNTKTLDLFGDRRKDRQPHVSVVDLKEAQYRIWRLLFHRVNKPTLGGKNVGVFDFQFLLHAFPDIKNIVNYRFIDIGNKYEDTLDPKLPDLKTCRERGIKCGIEVTSEVTHTAMDDAIVCAELYVGWRKGLVDFRNWRKSVE